MTSEQIAQAIAAKMVAKLAWETFGKECLRAEAVLGRYEVMWGFHNGQTSLDVPALRRTHTWHSTIEAAKSAAQADYTARMIAGMDLPVLVGLVEALKACVASLERVDTAEGVCCCGDDMDAHTDPMYCGHSPVDIGDYYAHKAIQAARTALKNAGVEV